MAVNPWAWTPAPAYAAQELDGEGEAFRRGRLSVCRVCDADMRRLVSHTETCKCEACSHCDTCYFPALVASRTIW